MADSILQLIFPLSSGVSNVNRKSIQQTSTKQVNLERDKVSLDVSAIPCASKETLQNSQISLSKSKDDSKSLCLLISDQKNVEPFHNRNLLFQCALTVATNENSSIPTSSARNGTVTIITPNKWDALPDCYVLGMRISSDNIERIMISNRIKFVYPKTYEELIIYLTSLHSTNQQNQTMYILEYLDYFLSTTEKQYIQRSRNNIHNETGANDTSVIIHENNQLDQSKIKLGLLQLSRSRECRDGEHSHKVPLCTLCVYF